MLNERDVALAKTKMGQILRGDIRCPDDVQRKAAVILKTLDLAARGDHSCGWISEWIHHKGFAEDLKKKLSPMTGNNRFSLMLLPMRGQDKELLDFHYWNDCAPWWRGAAGGRYGSTPGEDILIKLIAGKC